MIQEIKRNEVAITTVAREFEPRTFDAESALVLARVTGATPIPSAWARWVYTCEETWVGTAPLYVRAARPSGRTFDVCLSVSELGNNTPPTSISYGVSSVNLLGSFGPVRIPDLTPVVLSPHRMSDGTLIWLIVNTQAIDGTCEGPDAGSHIPVNPPPDP